MTKNKKQKKTKKKQKKLNLNRNTFTIQETNAEAYTFRILRKHVYLHIFDYCLQTA